AGEAGWAIEPAELGRDGSPGLKVLRSAFERDLHREIVATIAIAISDVDRHVEALTPRRLAHRDDLPQRGLFAWAHDRHPPRAGPWLRWLGATSIGADHERPRSDLVQRDIGRAPFWEKLRKLRKLPGRTDT